jgi:HD superfamily phosphodiesterase
LDGNKGTVTILDRGRQMADEYSAVWAAARPYMRARKNDVHVPMAFDFAQQLLEHHPEADRDVVSLAILLHDCGWAVVDQEAIFRDGFGPGMMEADVRFAHEREGVRIATEILDELGYPAQLRDAVTTIIDGHDTRREARSREDELVKDADALWRFTPTGVAVACDWFGETPTAYCERTERESGDRLFTEAAREIARREQARTRRLLRTEQLVDPLAAP